MSSDIDTRIEPQLPAIPFFLIYFFSKLIIQCFRLAKLRGQDPDEVRAGFTRSNLPDPSAFLVQNNQVEKENNYIKIIIKLRFG